MAGLSRRAFLATVGALSAAWALPKDALAQRLSLAPVRSEAPSTLQSTIRVGSVQQGSYRSFVSASDGILLGSGVASRLGAHCAFAGTLGRDEHSRLVLDNLRHEKVDVGRVVRRDGAGPVHSTIIVEEGRGTRTIFNLLGPLTNPAGAQTQLIGVGDPLLAPKIAEVMARLGTKRTLIVHSEGGLDEGCGIGFPLGFDDRWDVRLLLGFAAAQQDGDDVQPRRQDGEAARQVAVRFFNVRFTGA